MFLYTFTVQLSWDFLESSNHGNKVQNKFNFLDYGFKIIGE